MIHLFYMPPLVNVLVVSLVFIAALWRGDWPARVIASVQLLVQNAGSSICAPLHCAAHTSLRNLYATIPDVIVLVACLICAMRATRYWVVWASAFALLALACDLIGLLPLASPWAWLTASLIWSYLMSGAVLWGVWANVRGREATARATR